MTANNEHFPHTAGAPSAPLIARSKAELHEARRRLGLGAGTSAPPPSLALVPTMGALHDGHISLISAARSAADRVCASIFVNPTQFNDAADLARYPRDEDGDIARLAAAGCDLIWLPTVTDIYPDGFATRIEPAGPALPFEGALRPGHFAGVATIVTLLLNAVRPDIAIFGEKDWQQLQVIRRVAADLGLTPRIAGAPIVREADGLAMSSRNRFLTPAERAIAPQLAQCLHHTASRLAAGDAAATCLAAARAQLTAAGFVVEYISLIDGPSMAEISAATDAARLIAAARLGSVRLIDNCPVI